VNKKLRRREFITLAGGATMARPFAARAQQRPGKLPLIALLVSGTPASHGLWINAFAQRLRQLSWIEGRTVTIEYRWAEGDSARYVEIATELVQLKPSVIVTNGNAAVAAVKQVTSSIPIVFAVAGDPVGTGLVDSLARPGGNVTGLSIQQTDTATKRLELLRELLPHLRRLAIAANAANPAAALEMRDIRAAAETLTLEVTTFEFRRAEDIAPTIEALKTRADALYFVGDPLMNTHRVRINALTTSARLPAMYSNRSFVEAGGLISYGANFYDLYRRTAEYADKVLRGTKPSDLPVEQPTKFDLVINLTAARVLGLEVPTKLLALADEVIE
jgi:putative tryptophan/tyrosine transport system substrate-binding protein